MDLKSTYNKIAEDWHQDHHKDDWWMEGVNKFISYFQKNDLVLDVGCGSGVKTKCLISKGLKIIGIDFSENLIKIAKREVPNGDFQVLDIWKIDEIKEKFDGIFAQASLLHIPKKDIVSLLQKIDQKLKPSGYFYIAVKEKKSQNQDEEIVQENDYGYNYERFFSYFTMKELINYFQILNYKIVYKKRIFTGKKYWLQIIGQKIGRNKD